MIQLKYSANFQYIAGGFLITFPGNFQVVAA